MAESGGVYAGIAVVIGAACTGFATVYSALRARRRKDDEEIHAEAVRLAAEVLAEELLRRRFYDGEPERRGQGTDNGSRRRRDD